MQEDKMSSVVWIIAIVILLIFVFLKDKKIKASSDYKKAIESKQKPPRKLYIKRWWTWIIVIILIIAWWFNFSENVYHNDIANKENTSVKNEKHKSIKHKASTDKKKKENKAKKSKRKKLQLKDSQKAMSDDLYNDQDLKKYILKIKYTGDGNADINVASEFIDADLQSKTKIAKKVNNLVTSDAEDVGANADPYSFLTFIYQGKLIGHSKQFSHNEYKWQK